MTMAFALLLVTGSTVAFGQYTNRSSVLDGSGVVSSGGGYTHISASGQPGGISVAMAGTLPLNAGTIVNQAGLLNTFFVRPNLLSVRGVPVEADPDNDGDALSDVAEVTGSSFSPATPSDLNNPDSDTDGFPDGAEALAGTNPNDDDFALRITAITDVTGQRFVAWLARGNNERTYRVLTSPDLTTPFSTVIFSDTVAGGTYPWYAVTNVIADASATNKLFYRVAVACGAADPNGWVCWPGNQGGNGHWYRVVVVGSSGIAWDAANASVSPGSYLASITSAGENAFVYSLIPESCWNNGNFGPWIGGYQAPGSPEPAGGWGWTSGEPWSYAAWALDEPSNYYDLGTPENKLHYYQHSPIWNDLPNDPHKAGDYVYGFVEERNSAP